MKIVFTDLDGTLLDHHSYDWTPAAPALDRLKQTQTPWIFVTSKTRAESEHWRSVTGNTHPFIVENGAAAFIPRSYFPENIPGSQTRGEYVVIEWGTAYPRLVAALETASRSSDCRTVGFHQWSVEEIAADAGLPLHQAVLAKHREYDEPFRILDPDRRPALTAELERLGLRWTEGGRYFHVTGNNDKALAVQTLAAIYRRSHGAITTLGLGDGPNDLEFLQTVDHPVIIRSKSLPLLTSHLPHAPVTEHPGPAGWNRAVLDFLAR
jgi:mannosyl-3-phosphoglycerate phosphatase